VQVVDDREHDVGWRAHVRAPLDAETRWTCRDESDGRDDQNDDGNSDPNGHVNLLTAKNAFEYGQRVT
jgi:hypothetical protein